jgi:hypothetical protein
LDTVPTRREKSEIFGKKRSTNKMEIIMENIYQEEERYFIAKRVDEIKGFYNV